MPKFWDLGLASGFNLPAFCFKIQLDNLRVKLTSGYWMLYMNVMYVMYQRRLEDFGSGVGLVGGPGGGRSPPDARKFWKFPKNFSRKLQKMDYFRRFFKKIKNSALNFRALHEKPNCLGNFWEKFERFLWKKHKNALFWCIFKIISKSCVKFSRVLTKNTIVWEFFDKLFKNFLRK